MIHSLAKSFRKAPERIIALIFCILFFLFVSCGKAESGENFSFSVERIGQMICNRENIFLVHAPEEGEFSVRIYDDVYTYRIIRENVQKGETEVFWDGCGYNGEQLETKYYFFDFHLEGISGRNYSFFFKSPIIEIAQHLQFVLPSSETAFLSEPSDWFVETKAVRDGTVIFELYPDQDSGEPVFISEKSIHTGRVEHYSLEKIAGRNMPEPGNYSLQIHESSRPDETHCFPLRIEETEPAPTPVKVTGDIMPSRDADDQEIWQAMMQPSVIVDIDPMKHQNVYAVPDKKAVSLGTLHGQTQGLAVLETEEEWARIGAWNHEDASYIEGWVPLSCLAVAEPNHEYGVLIDKKEQTMTLFQNGKRIETLLVSTGRMDTGKYDRETSAGCFLTGLHRVDFSTQGLRYDYVIQYDGGNLLHQIPYSSDGRKDFTQGKIYLGTKASHACIRIQNTPGTRNGINAYWIWTHLPYRTRVIIMDDPEERSVEKARLSGDPPAEIKNSFSADAETQGEEIVLTFAGDLVPAYTEDPNGFDSFFRNNGAEYPLKNLQQFFANDDLTCVSLACVLKEDSRGEYPYTTGKWRGLPEYAKIFTSSSVELISLGDEHLQDFRQEGYEMTAKTVGQTAAWTGKGQSRIIEIKGRLFGFATIGQQEYIEDTAIIGREIRALREEGCDYIIIQCHWGNENETVHGKLQEAMARTCAREGADLVIGRHPDGVQGIGEIDGMPVVYSLGKLITDRSVRRKTYDSLIVQAVFDPEKQNEPEIRLIPVVSTSSAEGKTNDCCALPASGKDLARILELIQSDTGFRIPGIVEE